MKFAKKKKLLILDLPILKSFFKKLQMQIYMIFSNCLSELKQKKEDSAVYFNVFLKKSF